MAVTWLAQPGADGVLRTWLRASGSLSWRIQRACPQFAVQRLCQERAVPLVDEAALVGLLPGQRGLVRDVLLTCAGQPVVFAHSLLRCEAVRGPWRAVLGLGNRPLATMLYHDPRIQRLAMQYRQLNPRHPLYQRAAAVLPHLPSHLWARRSVFMRHGAALLVTEVFLPQIERLGATVPHIKCFQES